MNSNFNRVTVNDPCRVIECPECKIPSFEENFALVQDSSLSGELRTGARLDSIRRVSFR